MDDTGKAVAFNLKKCLERVEDLTRPVTFHDRTGHQLVTDNILTQRKVVEIEKFAKDNEMKINTSKCKLMLFNRSVKYDFNPKIALNNENIELAETMKLLGVVISSDLKWHSHVKLLNRRGHYKLCLFRRLKKLGADGKLLSDPYDKK